MSLDRMQTQRFEMKYVVNEATAQDIRCFVDHYLDLDEFGIGRPYDAYPVNSLYLDSGELETFQQWVRADRNRFKLRLRFYDEDPDTPVFLEIKRRVLECILKQRCSLKKPALDYVMAGQVPPPDLVFSRDPKAQRALHDFIQAVLRLQARPVLLVTYLREAYLDLRNNAVRVTLDRCVRMSPRARLDFSLRMDEFVQPFGDRVIVEIKFTNRFPGWAGQMVQTLGLRREGAAKYCEGVANLWRTDHAHWHYGHLGPHRYEEGVCGKESLLAAAARPVTGLRAGDKAVSPAN